MPVSVPKGRPTPNPQPHPPKTPNPLPTCDRAGLLHHAPAAPRILSKAAAIPEAPSQALQQRQGAPQHDQAAEQPLPAHHQQRLHGQVGQQVVFYSDLPRLYGLWEWRDSGEGLVWGRVGLEG